jgi:hypothetical protein
VAGTRALAPPKKSQRRHDRVPHGKYIGGALATRPKAKPNPSSTARWSLIAAPVGSPWMWTLAFRHHGDRTPTRGYAATREEAMKAFAKSWRRGVRRF